MGMASILNETRAETNLIMPKYGTAGTWGWGLLGAAN